MSPAARPSASSCSTVRSARSIASSSSSTRPSGANERRIRSIRVACASVRTAVGCDAKRHPPSVPASRQQLDRLHRHDDEREAPVQRKGLGVRGDGRHRQSRGLRAHRERVEQHRLEVQRRDLVSGARQLQGDAPRAGADVEDTTSLRRRELPPQPGVRGIAAALHVVPDDQRGEGHRQCPCTSPRAASRSRSSSSAV
jgi:hypothetical protein